MSRDGSVTARARARHQLVVSAAGPLARRDDRTGMREVLSALEEYQDAARGSGLTVSEIWLDDPDDMARLGLTQHEPTSGEGAAQAVRSVIKALDAERRVDSVLLLGDDESIPFARVANPVRQRFVDRDNVVLTDNTYGADSDAQLLAPSIPVGRLLGGHGLSALALRLRSVAREHRSRPRKRGSYAFINREWFEETAAVVKTLPFPVIRRQSPGHQLTPESTDELDTAFLYFNLHGFANQPAWRGFNPARGKYVTAVTPAALRQANLEGATIFCENCYGAQLVGNTAATSCARMAIDAGARTFIGPTGLAYGSFVNPTAVLGHSDWLAAEFFSACSSGETRQGEVRNIETVGEALQAARQVYMKHRKDTLTAFDRKTLLQYIMLGDPGLPLQ